MPTGVKTQAWAITNSKMHLLATEVLEGACMAWPLKDDRYSAKSVIKLSKFSLGHTQPTPARATYFKENGLC